MSNFKILFTRHNFTTDFYLEDIANSCTVFTCHNRKIKKLLPPKIETISVTYQPWYVGMFVNYFNLHKMYPQYIPDLQNILKRNTITHVVTPDIYDFIFSQSVRYEKKNPNIKLYVWSETRQWPNFWLSRWVMYGFWWYFKRNIQKVEKVFVFTNQGKQFFNKNAPEVAVEVMPAPIDINLFYPEVEKLYVPQERLRIIMNARYIPLKEHRTFFDALLLLKKRQIAFSVSLIGRGGHLQGELEEYAKQLGISESISWLEPVAMEELQAIYSAHDVLVLASNREAIGMVVPEAMACGLATVTSRAVGANTYVEEGKTGLIFETGNAAALADALEKLAEKAIVQAYGQAAAKVIREEYSVEVLGAKLLNALE